MENRPDKAPAAARSTHVQSVEVALQILEAIAESHGVARVNELSRRLSMTKAKVSRHLQTLLRLGLVSRKRNEGYAFGWKLLRLGRAATRDRSIGEIAKPHLQQLRDTVKQAVILSAPVPNGAVVLLCVESLENMSVTVRTATTLTLPKSPSARLSAALQPLAGKEPALPRGSGLKHWPDFGAEYEVDTGNGVGGVSAPVVDDAGLLLAIVSIVAPTRALAPKPRAADVKALRECVKAIENEYVQGPEGPAP
jgi:DNA-binding IclR family transcriptional regulator